MPRPRSTDVVVIGSGFGGSVAALRFSEARKRVVVLERGDWVHRDTFEIDLDYFWRPHRHRFGFHDIRKRGPGLYPWLGAAVGGGSHVYAGSLMRRLGFDDLPPAIASDDMAPYYQVAEDMLRPTLFPDYPPYSEAGSSRFLIDVGEQLQRERPELVEDYGRLPLGISFAPPGERPGSWFTNPHGAKQRYWDPSEQSLLGGDIASKNTLDLNYLHVAQQRGASIWPLCEADRIEPLEGGGYRVHFTRYLRERNAVARMSSKWFGRATRSTSGFLDAGQVVVAAGAIGSTELLIRNRDRHGTLTRLSDALGTRYTTNGDFVSAVISPKGLRPDVGPINGNYIRFRGVDGEPQGVYIESGRYPTPVKLVAAILLSSFGLWTPERYPEVARLAATLRGWIPGWRRLARAWPLPLLTMGRDRAHGVMSLDADDRLRIDFDVNANREYYAYLDELSQMIATAGGVRWIPNFLFRRLGVMEVPHNQGGAPMGESAADGVVDHAGRVFGYPGLYVLDGSIIPVSLGPNPALTILALAERAMKIILDD